MSQETPEHTDTQHLTKAERRAKRRAEKDTRQRSQRNLELRPRTATQASYLRFLQEDVQIFGIGPAGTGKTYLAARHGMARLKTNQIEKIIVSRPTVSQPRHRQGFLPGNAKAKQAPWLVPIMDAFKDEVTAGVLEKMMTDEQVEIVPFEYMRGRTFRNAIVILDEAQNCSFGDLKMFLTRVGEGSQVIICGDMDQVDIEDSGLAAVVDLADHFDFIEAAICEFDHTDVVRSKVARQWVQAFSKTGRK
jgi:phosphate starvation-inducible PhoH-like protein